MQGSKTIAYVYEKNSSGKNATWRALYYYYINSQQYVGECVVPQHCCHPKNKFYIVYYMPDDPNNSILEFNQEIRPDCVYKYFPQGANPFMNEIKQYDIER